MKTAELKVIIDKHTTSLADFEAIWGAVNKYMQSHPSPMSVEQVEELGYYYPLFKFFSDEHGLSLLDSQLQDVIHECKKFIEPASPSVKADGWVSVEEKKRLEQIIELKEKERQEWANMCISKQKRIDELENPLKAAPPNVNN